MKNSRKPHHKTKPPKQGEMDIILSSPKLLHDIETAKKELREGKLLTRDRKKAFNKEETLSSKAFSKTKQRLKARHAASPTPKNRRTNLQNGLIV